MGAESVAQQIAPGNHAVREVDLKLAAKVSGNKKADLIPMKELLPVTGYIRGGCSPIGMSYIGRHPRLPINRHSPV